MGWRIEMNHVQIYVHSLHFRIFQTWLISMTCSKGIHATYFLISLCYHLMIGLIISLYHSINIHMGAFIHFPVFQSTFGEILSILFNLANWHFLLAANFSGKICQRKKLPQKLYFEMQISIIWQFVIFQMVHCCIFWPAFGCCGLQMFF